MKKIYIFLLSALVLLSLLTACSTTTTDPADAFKGQSPQKIYHDGVTALRNHSYSDAIKRFEALDVQYPYGLYTENAQLYVIYAYYMKEDYALSVAAADHFIRLHPSDPHIDYAYYLRGLANYYQNLGPFERLFQIDKATRDLSQIEKSYDDFKTVALQYPNSYYAPSAYQYMIYLRNVLADYQIHIAEFYYEHNAFVASANRASYLVAHYQGAPQVVDGLIMMAKSYRKLGLTRLEQDTLRVLQYNYPNIQIDYGSKFGVILS